MKNNNSHYIGSMAINSANSAGEYDTGNILYILNIRYYNRI